MFLAWNYTLELFFWIILGAVILVSLTVFLARPRFRSKGSETSEETLSLTGENVDSPEENVLDQDAASSGVEEEFEILEEIEKGETAWTQLRGWVRNIPIRLVRWVVNIPIRLGRWVVNIPVRLVRWIRNIPTQLRRLGRWIRDIPARLVRGVRNILRFLRKEWKAIVVGIGFCFYFVMVCVLGALIVFDSWGTSMSLAGAQGWDALETLITRMGLVFGGAIFFTGVISAYSFLAENQKWLRNSCRASAIVLLLFSIFYLGVGNIDWDSTTGNFYSQEDELWQWERNLETAGIASFYLMFASFLFSGDLKRIWKWMATSLTDDLPLSVRIRDYAIILAYVGYVNFIEIVGIVFLLEGLPQHLYDDFLHYHGGDGGLIFIIVGFATLLSGLLSLYGFLAKRNILLRDSCRAAAALFLLIIIFGTGWDDILGFVIIPLLFSGDLKRLWERILSNERIKQLIGN
jgi:hypothetical protein